MVATASRVTNIEEGRARLVGCMTGAANVVKEHLARIDRPAKVSRFLDWFERASFGWAGAHADSGHEATWCFFRLTKVVEATGMSRFDVIHSRQWLVDAHILWYDISNIPVRKDGTGPDGRIGWNLNYAEWTPPKHGGKRPGAGRPRKQPPVAILNSEQAPIADLNFSDSQTASMGTGRSQGVSLPISGEAPGDLAIGNKSSLQCQVGKNDSSLQCLPDETVFKSAMAVSLESAPGEARVAPVRKVTEEVITEEITPNGVIALPTADAYPSSSGSHDLWGEKPGKTKRTRKSDPAKVWQQPPLTPLGEAVAQFCHWVTPLTKSSWGWLIGAEKELRDVGVGPDDFSDFDRKWTNALSYVARTPTSLTKHLPELRGAPAQTSPTAQKGANNHARRHPGEYTGDNGPDAEIIRRPRTTDTRSAPHPGRN